MSQVVLTYRVEVNGFIFVTFDPLQVRPDDAGVERIDVECLDETPITIQISFSSGHSVDEATITGNRICQRILNVLAFKYCLSVQQLGIPSVVDMTKGVDGVSHSVSESMTCTVSGKRTEDLDATQSAALRTELESPYVVDADHLSLFREAMQAEDVVDRFLSLYRILSLLFRDPKTGKDCQKTVDDFLENECKMPRTDSTRSDGKGKTVTVKETLYSRLRNEIAHARDKIDLVATRNAMEANVYGIAGVVRKAIQSKA